MRVAALWFPDWPVQAARRELGVEGPLAIVGNHRIRAHSGGLRRGMKVRQAQALIPALTLLADVPDRDGRVFAEIAASLDDVASSIEVLRPGLVVVDAAAAARFHGGEDVAVEMLLDAATRINLDVQVGVADEIATAVLAARHNRIVTDSRAFLSGLPVRSLEAVGCDRSVLSSLNILGVRALGELAALPPESVATRFGSAGMLCHRIARAEPDRRVAPDPQMTPLAVTVAPEDPIERLDEAAFAGRALAARLHGKLRDSGRACLRLQITAELEQGVVERVWRTREPLTESATADRVRWQLDGWLTGGNAGRILSLTLTALDTAVPAAHELWQDGTSTAAARRVVERVQSTLGVDRVLQPRHAGGRGVAERIDCVPFGERPAPGQDGSWSGRIPSPLPARLGSGPQHPAARVRLVDARATDVYVTAEALLSSDPYALGWGRTHYLVVAWSGPWPVDMGWWRGQQPVARLQVVGVDGSDEQRAWLLIWVKGWRVEATYG